MAGLDRAVTDRQAGLAREPSLALDNLDAAGLHQAGEALVELADHAVLVGVDARHVDAVEGRLDTELLGALFGVVGDLGGVQQRLRRDATPVQAGAADLVTLDHDHRHPQLGGTQGGSVAAAAGAQDGEIDRLARRAHTRLLCGTEVD